MIGDYLFRHEGERIRVVIAGDVISLPQERWSGDGYGAFISADWLLGNAKLPGRSKARKRLLADCIVAALEAHAGRRPPKRARPMVPHVKCGACSGAGIVPKRGPLTVATARQELAHVCDGPLTRFVLLTRAVELAADQREPVTVANALEEELAARGFYADPEPAAEVPGS